MISEVIQHWAYYRTEAANHLEKTNHSVQVIVSPYATDAILRAEDALLKATVEDIGQWWVVKIKKVVWKSKSVT